MKRCFKFSFPALTLLAGGGCVQVCSPLFPAPMAPIVVDRACPQWSGPAMAAPERAPTAAPGPAPAPPEIESTPRFPPGTPPVTPAEPLPAVPAFTVPRLVPPGNGRGRTRLADAGGVR